MPPETTQRQDTSRCPQCGEPVKAGWRLCPVCETRLRPLACPQCGALVKDNWKRCPECETRLQCPGCGRRLNGSRQQCPHCSTPAGARTPDGTSFQEEICGIAFVPVSSGTYPMGDIFGEGLENETPVHDVHLDAFFISRTPVTQRQWCCLMTDNPSRFRGEERPVEQVSFFDVMLFINRIDRAHGEKFEFRLPTEAQWEYAARSGGGKELYAGGNDIERLGWYEVNSGGGTRPVAEKAPNGIGLFDMSGNVWEWCRDTYHEDAYRRHDTDNPVLEDPKKRERVIRGGSWNLDAWSLRCARRFSFPEDYLGAGLGFRLVLESGPESL
ncbi:MAG: SUMF1/EgtB/PvdO family nonheme iron enzyme [Desulfobacteraceae bacterium]|nr:SUMF1/EgtB/PvdO family nonheme iron enzyme [Desulfobacteraceae bacterium]